MTDVSHCVSSSRASLILFACICHRWPESQSGLVRTLLETCVDQIVVDQVFLMRVALSCLIAHCIRK